MSMYTASELWICMSNVYVLLFSIFNSNLPSRTKESPSLSPMLREYKNEALTLSLMYAYMITYVMKKETYISGSLILCDN